MIEKDEDYDNEEKENEEKEKEEKENEEKEKEENEKEENEKEENEIKENEKNEEINTGSDQLTKEENIITEQNNININVIEDKKEDIISDIKSDKESILKSLKNIYIDKTSEVNGKTIYYIKGDFINEKDVIIRRYRDFDLLHNKLVENWPGIFIPPIAQKKYFSSTAQKTVNERIYLLENFLKSSTKMEYLKNTDELQIFLNKNYTNSDAVQIELKKLKPFKLKDISENYTKYFSNYKNIKTKNFDDEQLNNCISFINNLNAKINIYKEKLVDFGEIKKTKIYRESRIATYFTEFEKYCILEYANNDLSLLFFFNNNATLLENKKKYKELIDNPYLLFSCWLRLKELELISMKNSLNVYKSLLAKKTSIENKQKEISQKLEDAKNGRISFFTKIMMKGDVEELKGRYRNELFIQNNEVNYINNIINILKDYLSVEVYKYFDDLTAGFYKTVKKFATIQEENCTLATNLWLNVKCKKNENIEDDNVNDIIDEFDDVMNDNNESNTTENNNNLIESKTKGENDN